MFALQKCKEANGLPYNSIVNMEMARTTCACESVLDGPTRLRVSGLHDLINGHVAAMKRQNMIARKK